MSMFMYMIININTHVCMCTRVRVCKKRLSYVAVTNDPNITNNDLFLGHDMFPF